jgi:hypothetical protein
MPWQIPGHHWVDDPSTAVEEDEVDTARVSEEPPDWKDMEVIIIFPWSGTTASSTVPGVVHVGLTCLSHRSCLSLLVMYATLRYITYM